MQYKRVCKLVSVMTKTEKDKLRNFTRKNASNATRFLKLIMNESSLSKKDVKMRLFGRANAPEYYSVLSRAEEIIKSILFSKDSVKSNNYPLRVEKYFDQLNAIQYHDLLQFRGLRSYALDILEKLEDDLLKIESFDLLVYVLKRQRRHLAQFGTVREIENLDRKIANAESLSVCMAKIDWYLARFNEMVKDSISDSEFKSNLEKYLKSDEMKFAYTQSVHVKVYYHFFKSALYYWKKDYLSCFIELRTLRRYNSSKTLLFLKQIESVTLLNMSQCLLWLGAYTFSRSIIYSYLSIADSPVDKFRGLSIQLKIGFISNDIALVERAFQKLIQLVELDSVPDSSLADVALLLKACNYLFDTDKFELPISEPRLKSLFRNRFEGNFYYRLIEIQVSMKKEGDYKLNQSKMIENIRKAYYRARKNGRLNKRLEIIIKVLNGLGYKSISFKDTYRLQVRNFNLLSLNIEPYAWDPSSLEFLPFEHWFKCMAEGKPYTHPPYLKEKKVVDYTKAGARVSLR